MTSSLISFATQTAEHTTIELPFPAIWFGIITLSLFMGLLGLLWAFRATAIRMTDPEHDASPHRH